MAQLDAEIVAHQVAGADLPASLMRMSRRLAAEWRANCGKPRPS
jgi:hypothetical protein